MAMNPSVAIRFIAQSQKAVQAMRQVKRESQDLERGQEEAAQKAVQRQEKVRQAHLRTALAVGTVVAALGLAGRRGIQTAAEVELAQLTFQSFTGSAALAKERYEELLQFAAQTPLQITEIVRGVQVLNAFGLAAMDSAEAMKELKHRMLLFGLAAKVTQLPGGAEQVIRAFADLRAGVMEIRQLSAIGISRDFLRAEGVKFGPGGELLSPGIEAFEAGMRILERRYGTLLEGVEDTIATKASNVADKIFIIWKNVTDPVRRGIKDTFSWIVDFLDRVGKAAEKSGGSIRDTLGAAVAMLWPLWVPLVAGLKGFLALAEKAPGVLQAITMAVVGLTVAWGANRIAMWGQTAVLATTAVNWRKLMTAMMFIRNYAAYSGGLAAIRLGLAKVGAALVPLLTSWGTWIVLIGLAAYGIKKLIDYGFERAYSSARKLIESVDALEEKHKELARAQEKARKALAALDPTMRITDERAREAAFAFAEFAATHEDVARAAGISRTEHGYYDETLGRLMRTASEYADAEKRITELQEKKALEEDIRKAKELTEEYRKRTTELYEWMEKYKFMPGLVANTWAIEHRYLDDIKDRYDSLNESIQQRLLLTREEGRLRELRLEERGKLFEFSSERAQSGFGLLTQDMRDSLAGLAGSIQEIAPGLRLRMTETVAKGGPHVPGSLHEAGRAVDISKTTVYALADRLGGLFEAFKFLGDVAKKQELRLLVESPEMDEFLKAAKSAGLATRVGGTGPHIHAATLSKAETAAFEAMKEGQREREKLAEDAAKEAEKLARERERALRDEHQAEERRLKLLSETAQVGLDEKEKAEMQVKLAEDLLALAQEYVEKGLLGELDLMEAKLDVLKAQSSLSEQTQRERERQFEIERQWAEQQRAWWDAQVERDREARAAALESGRLQLDQAESAADFADRMWRLTHPLATKEERLEHERQRIVEDLERAMQWYGAIQEALNKLQWMEAEAGFTRGALMGFDPEEMESLTAQLQEAMAEIERLRNELELKEEEIAQEQKSFYRNIRQALYEGIREIGRSAASGDIARALERTFNTIAEIIAAKAEKMIGGGIKGALAGGLIFGAIGLIGKALGLGKDKVQEVKIMNRYLPVRWDEEGGYAIPPRGWMQGSIEITMGAFNAQFSGASAEDASKEIARQVASATRRGLTEAFAQ